jgi:putative DNA primase/helicase
VVKLPVATSKPKRTEFGHRTDTSNGKWFAEEYEHTARYCPAFRSWLIWNGSYWERDDSSQVQRMAKAVVERMWQVTGQIQDDKERAEARAWCRVSETQARLDAMLKSAQSELTITPQELDAEPYLLCCENGTLHLKSGKLRDHDPSDFITLMAPVQFKSGATDDRWEELLDKFVRPDEGKEAFLGRAAFASLTGTTSDKVFLNLYDNNDGNTGKTTFLESLLAAVGPYGEVVSAEAFLTKPNGAPAIRSDIATLAGKRFVVSSETPPGRKLDTALMKKLTQGGGRFMFERKYENPWTGEITFTIWLDGNSVAKANAEDNPLFHRWRLTPFMHEIPKASIDKRWMEKAAASPEYRTAVLAWVVRYRAAWLKGGIGSAVSVDAATEEVRANMDPLRLFWDECCEFVKYTTGSVYFATTRELLERYARWVSDQPGNARPINQESFLSLLKGRGAENGTARVDGKPTRVWKGVRVREPAIIRVPRR